METSYFIGLDNEDGSQRQVLVEQQSEALGEKGIMLHDAFNLSIEGENAGGISFTEDYTDWEYNGPLSYADQETIATTLQRRFSNSALKKAKHSEAFTLIANVNQDDVIVEVTPSDGDYYVKINGDDMGSIYLDEDNYTWIGRNKELSDVLVQEIGLKIESYYG